MHAHASPVIAWVESPLQLIGAAEWAAARGRRVPVAGRLTPQMSETADELLARGAMFGACEPYLGIPWTLLARHGHWLVGDGFSGQFRLAASVLRPRSITFLDDGANTLPFVDALTGDGPYTRPGVSEGGLTTRVAPFAAHHVLGRMRARAVEVFTAFDLGEQRLRALGELGGRVERHGFSWTRRSAPAFTTTTGGRVVLGSARVVDGRVSLAEYLDWVTRTTARGPVTYLPHRRETDEQLAAVQAIAGVLVVDSGLPAELLLAGTTEPLELLTLPSSTTTTLPLVLAGTGSAVRAEAGVVRGFGRRVMP